MFKYLVLCFCLTSVFSCGGGGEPTNTVIPKIMNTSPLVNAGVDQLVDEQTSVTLAGTASDTDGSIASYAWSQTSGTTVTLTNTSNISTSFTAPNVTSDEVFTFELTVTDNEDLTSSDSVNITVNPIITTPNVQAITTNYNFWCSSNTEAVAWFDDSIAIVIEGNDALAFDHATMTRMVEFFHRLYYKYESITGLTNLPLDTPWQEHITIQIPLDNCGAGGLANHGVRGISVGRGFFDEQYDILLSGQERYHQVFFYESNRNFWPPYFNESFDWAMDDDPMNWGWWTVGMNNAMAVMMSDMLDVELEYFGQDSMWFRDRMVANFETYKSNSTYNFDYGWRQEYMPWNANESINDLMSGLMIHSYETWGGETWLTNFYQAIGTVLPRSDVFAYQECRDNIYHIWSDAAEVDLLRFFVDELRWNITSDSDAPAPILLQYSLADALAGGDGSFPGTGSSGTSVVVSLNQQDFSARYRIVDGAFVPQKDGETVVSTSGITFDFSAKTGISQHDGIPSKGPYRHSDPSLQSHNLGTNPDYSGDPDNHAFIDMHATVGLTYNLDKIRLSYNNGAAITKFTARFGSATGAKINYWVLLDGIEVHYGELLSGSPEVQDVDINLTDDNVFLTLVIADANTGTINNAHGYIGDPILHSTGLPTDTAAIPTNPIDKAASALAWQTLHWNYGLGVENYDIYLWKEAQPQPSTPSYNISTTELIPYEYLAFGEEYNWKIISNLSDTSLESPVYSFIVQPENLQTDPIYNISPAAQAERTALYTLDGINQITGIDSYITSGMRIGFYGDSNTDVIVWQQSLVDALSIQGATSLNRGINGADIQELWEGIRSYAAGGGLAEPEPFADQIMTDDVDVAIIYIGINDVLNNNPNTSTASYKSYLNLIVQACITNNIKVVLVAATTYNEKPDGSNLYDVQLDEYQKAAEEVALSSGVTFVPARTHFLNYLKNNNVSVQEDGNVIFPYQTGILNSDVVHHNETGKIFLSDLVADGLQRSLVPD
ncbi:SGNH/GDSL hydrolase family protein [Colwellia sp. Bg11-12]|uniref:SGNH/GDSL hydrolase family protein n=1 Tax=Colwellia sp. Bg11-12 TaxID=2759817 RepID=UPI0015F43A48|nr:SGNH/GDSL hydrolase family protein [Colwellia sp. Bg11-12]MBA6264537.1 hypothetical protein [Colwellia sp. Bg11-12]